MPDIVERLREGIFGSTETKTDAVINAYMHEAADEIEKLRAALCEIEYLDRPQVRGQPRRVSIQEIARAALGEKE